jgi:hypothetical protein
MIKIVNKAILFKLAGGNYNYKTADHLIFNKTQK